MSTVIDRARRAGANVPARLNEARLLWTPAREHEKKVAALQDLLNEFQVWLPHEYLRLVNQNLTNCTPTHMYNGIQEWLQRYVDHAKKGV